MCGLYAHIDQCYFGRSMDQQCNRCSDSRFYVWYRYRCFYWYGYHYLFDRLWLQRRNHGYGELVAIGNCRSFECV